MKVIFYEITSSFHQFFQIGMTTGVFCQFSFRWIYNYGSNKSTGLETAKSYLCANPNPVRQFSQGKTCFHYREPLSSLQAPCFHYMDFPVNSSTSLLRIALIANFLVQLVSWHTKWVKSCIINHRKRELWNSEIRNTPMHSSLINVFLYWIRFNYHCPWLWVETSFEGALIFIFKWLQGINICENWKLKSPTKSILTNFAVLCNRGGIARIMVHIIIAYLAKLSGVLVSPDPAEGLKIWVDKEW